MKQVANKSQLIEDQVRVNNSLKLIIEGGLVRHKTPTTSLKSNNIFKIQEKQTNSTQQSNTTPNQKINAPISNQLKNNSPSTQLNSSQSKNKTYGDTSPTKPRINKSQNSSSDTNQNNSDKKPQRTR